VVEPLTVGCSEYSIDGHSPPLTFTVTDVSTGRNTLRHEGQQLSHSVEATCSSVR
jgi:hypothetical protein